MQNRAKKASSQSGIGKTCQPYAKKKVSSDLYLTACAKVKLKWIKSWYQTPNHKVYRIKHSQNTYDIETLGIFKEETPLSKEVETDINT